MHRAVVVLLAAGLAVATAEGPFTTPVIVDSLAAHRQQVNAPKPANLQPLPYPNNDEHQWVSKMHSLQHEIETHDKTLADLNKNIEEAKAYHARLALAQKLFHAMVTLHQSETVLSAIDKRTDKVKEEIKTMSTQADDKMREMEDLKKQLEEAKKGDGDKLKDLKAKLQQAEEMLKKLCDKRSEVADIVSQWRSHVDMLRAAHGLPPRGGGESLTIPQLPRPPKPEEEAEEEAVAEEAAAAGAVRTGSGSDDSEEAERKAPTETVEAQAVPSTDSIKVTEKDLAANQAIIHDFLNVHLPKIQGEARRYAAQTTSFLEELERRM